MKILLITANFGGFDLPKTIPQQENNRVDVVLVDENNMEFPMTSLDNRMKAKYYKLQTHKLFPNYDLYIWIDGAFQIKSNYFVDMMRKEMANVDIAVTKHPDRNCIYTETEFVMQGLIKKNPYFLKRYLTSQLNLERNHYQKIGYPENNGLYACGLFARWGNEKMNSFFDKWWDSCLRWSVFDQLSFPVLAMENSVKINPLTFDNYLNNEFYQITKHQVR